MSRPPLSYAQFGVVDELLSSGDIDSRWKFDRESIRKKGGVSGTLPVDNFCMSKESTKTQSMKHRCVGCTVISRLSDQEIVPGSKIEIRAGKLAGSSFTLQDCETAVEGYTETTESKRVGLSIYERLSRLESCQPGISKRLDSTLFKQTFSATENYAVNSSIMEALMSDLGIRPLFQWGYNCSKIMNIINEVPNLGIGSFSKFFNETPGAGSSQNDDPAIANDSLHPEVVSGIITQLVIALKRLGESDFVHGAPSLIYLGWNSNPNSFTVKGATREHRVVSPITLHLSPSSYSSITHNGVRYFENSEKRTSNINRIPSESMEVWMASSTSKDIMCFSSSTGESLLPCLPELATAKVQGYKIGNRLSTYISTVRGLGLPLFTSFDLYLFLFALLCEPVFYRTAIKDVKFMDTWKQMFKHNEYESMMSNLEKASQLTDSHLTFEQLANLFSPYSFRCDAVDFLYYRLFD